MLVVRQGYGCDCDGVSHRDAAVEAKREQSTMRAMVQSWLGAVESIVGMRPHTCPWRALYHPLVIEVCDLVALAERNLALARAGTDPSAILLDAVVVYETSRSKSLAHHLDQRRNEDEAKRKK